MKDKIMTFLFLLLTNAVQRITLNRGAYQEITQLQLTLYYLKVIKVCRLLFISSLGLGISIIFLLSSLVLFHVTFFLYAPCSVETKMWVGFIFAAGYLVIAARVFIYIFAEENWLKTFNVQNLLNKAEVTPEKTV
jgi:hypothetical protein